MRVPKNREVMAIDNLVDNTVELKKIVIGDRFISNDPRNCNLLLYGLDDN